MRKGLLSSLVLIWMGVNLGCHARLTKTLQPTKSQAPWAALSPGGFQGQHPGKESRRTPAENDF